MGSRRPRGERRGSRRARWRPPGSGPGWSAPRRPPGCRASTPSLVEARPARPRRAAAGSRPAALAAWSSRIWSNSPRWHLVAVVRPRLALPEVEAVPEIRISWSWKAAPYLTRKPRARPARSTPRRSQQRHRWRAAATRRRGSAERPRARPPPPADRRARGRSPRSSRRGRRRPRARRSPPAAPRPLVPPQASAAASRSAREARVTSRGDEIGATTTGRSEHPLRMVAATASSGKATVASGGHGA